MVEQAVVVFHNQAQKFLNAGKLKESHGACLKVLELSPRHADAHFLLGMIAFSLKQMTKAIGLIDAAIKLNSKNIEYYAYHAKCLALVNRYPEAHHSVDKALEFGTEIALINDTLGVVLSRLGDHGRAIDLFRKAIQKQPNNPNFYYNLAASLKFSGDFDGAFEAYERVISLQPTFYQAHSALAELMRATKANNNISRLVKLQSIAGPVPHAQLHLSHALAKEYECLGEYVESLKALRHGNKLQKQSVGYDIEKDSRLFDAIKANFNDIQLPKSQESKASKQPIFVVGMPRSGTTLVDRIISSHSLVVSAGELQNFAVELKKMTATPSNQVLDVATIQAAANLDFEMLANRYIHSTQPLSDQTPHFIDKMPLNFLYIGFIKQAFPSAKIIVLKRNAMDTCLSNFRTLFAVNFSYYNYSYDLLDTAKYFSMFTDLIDFWKSKFGDDIHEVSYETLVAEPESTISDMLAYCELDVEDTCFKFHENKAPVSTASSVQVRAPLNASSIDRWKRYGNELVDLEQYLESKNLL